MTDPGRVDVPPPPSPEPGTVHRELTGAITRVIDAEGPRCTEWDGLLDVHAQGSAGADRWRLTSTPPHDTTDVSGNSSRTLGDARLSFGKGNAWVWEGLPGTGTVTFSKQRIDYDAVLTLWTSTDTIHVKGFV